MSAKGKRMLDTLVPPVPVAVPKQISVDAAISAVAEEMNHNDLLKGVPRFAFFTALRKRLEAL